MRPIVLIAGGPGRKIVSPDPVFAAAVATAGKDRPRVAYIGAASGDHPGFLERIGAMLAAAGAGPVTLVPTARWGRGGEARARALLDAADLVFVSGGDVEEGMRLLTERGLVGVLRELRAQGKPFAGLSAGSIMLAPEWVRWRDPDDDATAEPFECLGIVPVLCDMHGEDDDWAELKALLGVSVRCAGQAGYGVPAGAGLSVAPDGTVSALALPVHRFATRAGGACRRLPDFVPR